MPKPRPGPPKPIPGPAIVTAGVSPHPKSVLIIGNGSMGQRRSKIIHDLRPNWKRTTVDPVNGDLLKISLDGAIKYDLVFICTPPSDHISWVYGLLASQVPVFVEKPICEPAGVGVIRSLYDHQPKAPVMVGYNLLWHKGFHQFQSNCKSLGQIISYHARYGNLLTNWVRANTDPYSRYRAQGGGVLLDCLQDIDLALEITGGLEPVSHRQLTEGSDITADSEYVSLTTAIQPGSSTHAVLEFDYLRIPRLRQHSAMGLNGEEATWTEHGHQDPNLDQSYISETEAFIRWVETGNRPEMVPDPFRALEFVRQIYAL